LKGGATQPSALLKERIVSSALNSNHRAIVVNAAHGFAFPRKGKPITAL
jgi:hypothetical protein